MSSLTPMSGSSGLTPRQAAQANRAQRRGQMEVFNHGVGTTVAVEKDRQDTCALADVITTAIEEELGTLDYGLALAGNSAAKTELVARKVNLMSNMNNRRIARFGR